jgi:two-component sensor histidine kinase
MSFKHVCQAFPFERTGEVDVTLGWIGPGLLRLAVRDDGVGFPADLDFRNTKTLGMQLVCSLTTQLRGTVEMARDRGTRFEIGFSADARPTARHAVSEI